MSAKATVEQHVKAELARFRAAEDVVNAAMLLYAAVKVTAAQQPQMVVAALPLVETALGAWAKMSEIDAAPESEATEC